MSWDTLVISSVFIRSARICSCTALSMPLCSRFMACPYRRKAPNSRLVSTGVDRSPSDSCLPFFSSVRRFRAMASTASSSTSFSTRKYSP